MNKQIFQKMFLILLPVLAVGLATTNNSVTVFLPESGITLYGSYFALIPETGNMQILPPLAAVLAVAAVVLACLYAFRNQTSLVRAILWVSLLSAAAAALPVALGGEMVVLPNVLLPLLMCAQAAIAYAMTRNPQEKKPNSGRRLEKR